MNYEINVSKNGKHYFATHERSLTGQSEAEKAFKDFQERFPESEGFEVTISYTPKVWYSCHLDENGKLVNGFFEERFNQK